MYLRLEGQVDTRDLSTGLKWLDLLVDGMRSGYVSIILLDLILAGKLVCHVVEVSTPVR